MFVIAIIFFPILRTNFFMYKSIKFLNPTYNMTDYWNEKENNIPLKDGELNSESNHITKTTIQETVQSPHASPSSHETLNSKTPNSKCKI